MPIYLGQNGFLPALLIGAFAGVSISYFALRGFYYVITRMNGAPFRKGDVVQILVGEYQGHIAGVYEEWRDRKQVRVDLGDQAAKDVKDVFSLNELCRAEERYSPIRVDFSVPRQCERNTVHGKWCRFIMRVQSKLGLLIYCDLTYENQIDSQLKARREFPLGEWKECFSDVKVVRKILKDAAVSSGRVNHHYIPSDSLLCLLWDDVESDGCVFLSFSLRDFAGIQCAPEDITEMAKSQSKGRDAHSVLCRRTRSSGHPGTR